MTRTVDPLTTLNGWPTRSWGCRYRWLLRRTWACALATSCR